MNEAKINGQQEFFVLPKTDACGLVTWGYNRS